LEIWLPTTATGLSANVDAVPAPEIKGKLFLANVLVEFHAVVLAPAVIPAGVGDGSVIARVEDGDEIIGGRAAEMPTP
jgi:hypothetical protein